jgi:hypothetical protein
MPNTQSKIKSIKMECTDTINTSVELLTTPMSLPEQNRQQRDCMELIREYPMPCIFGSPIQNMQTHQIMSSRMLLEYDILNFNKLILCNEIGTNNEKMERINNLYDDVIRCVTLEAKQILTYIDKQRIKICTNKDSEERSKTFVLTDITDKLGLDLMKKIRSYMPMETLTRAYSCYLDKPELYNKMTVNVPIYNRMNLREIYEIVVEIMGKRREQTLLGLYHRHVLGRDKEAHILRRISNEIFDPVFKNGSTTARSQYNIGKRIQSIIQVSRNCMKCAHKDEFVKVNFQKMGMDFADLINHLYNCSDYKKAEYYSNLNEPDENKKKLVPISTSDYNKIKYLYEEVGESWKIIACHYRRKSYTTLKRLYETEKDKEFTEEWKKSREEERAPCISGLYENRKKNKHFNYIKYGLSKSKNITKYLSVPLME